MKADIHSTHISPGSCRHDLAVIPPARVALPHGRNANELSSIPELSFTITAEATHICSHGPTPRLLITPREAAFALSISTRKLWSLTNAGHIPSVRLGRAIRYSPADLENWIREQRGKSR
jgi:excisionase family DNA binding protein